MGCGSSSANGIAEPVSPRAAEFTQVLAPEEACVDHPRYVTMHHVSAHRKRTSCWCVIEGIVYDLTPFLDRHPGGSGYLLNVAGEDATDSFMMEHATSQQAFDELAKLRIGELVPEGDPRAGQLIPKDRKGVSTTTEPPEESPTPGAVTVLQSFPLSKIATRITPDNAWSIRNGQVYDIARLMTLAYQESDTVKLPQDFDIEWEQIVGKDATKYWDKACSKLSSLNGNLQRVHIGFVDGHAIEESKDIIKYRTHHPTASETSEALAAINHDPLTMAAQQGLLEAPPATRYVWKLLSKRDLTHDTVLLVLQQVVNDSALAAYRKALSKEEIESHKRSPPKFSLTPMVLKSGQHVAVEIPGYVPRENPENHVSRERENLPFDSSFRMQRSYTPVNVSMDQQSGCMQLVVKKLTANPGPPPTPAGVGSTYLHDLCIGSHILTTGARGLLDLEAMHTVYDVVVMLAAGSGITPCYAVLQDILARLNSPDTTQPFDLAGTSAAAASPTPSSGSSSPATPGVIPRSRKKVVFICANKSEEDQIFFEELNSLASANPDVLSVYHVLSKPLFSPRHSSFSGQLNMDVLRIAIPAFLLPAKEAVLAPGEEVAAVISGGARTPSFNAIQASPKVVPLSLAPSSAIPSGSSPNSRPRTPSKFTFGVESGGKPPRSPIVTNGDLIVPDGLTSAESEAQMMRSRAAAALIVSSHSQSNSRRPSITAPDANTNVFLVPSLHRSIALVCGPPGFNQTAMALMSKLGFKRGMNHSSTTKDLFVF